MTDQWGLPLPWRRPPISANDRPHWAAKNKLAQEIKTAVGWVARAKKVPKLQAVMVEMVWYPGNNRRVDGENFAPTLKYCVDGLVSVGILPDDDSERVLSSRSRAVIQRNDPLRLTSPRLILVIQDASALAPLPHYGPEGQAL